MSASWATMGSDDFAQSEGAAPDLNSYGNWEAFMRWDDLYDAPPTLDFDQGPLNYGTSNQQPDLIPNSGANLQASINPSYLSSLDSNQFRFDGLSNNIGNSISPGQQPNHFGQNFAQPQFQPMMGFGDNSLSLTPQEQEQLRSIAFANPLGVPTQGSRGSYDVDMGRSLSSSPEPRTSKKRKSFDDDDVELSIDSKEGKPVVKKTAHNMIEKRYRTNINDKIAALRDSVPSLRVMSKASQGISDAIDDPEDLDGLTPANKLNKATVLSKATEYIKHLERRNKRMNEENEMLRKRLDAFEKLAMAGALGPANTFNPGASNTGYSQGRNDQGGLPNENTNNDDESSQIPLKGMIQVPENIRRMHEIQGQQKSYMDGSRSGGGLLSKFMVGSLLS